MFKLRSNTLFILVALAALLGTSYASASPEAAPSAGQPMVAVEVIPVDTQHILIPVFGIVDFVKIPVDLGTFDVLSASSVVELTFNGRIRVSDFQAGSAGAFFELRVDNTATTNGIARAHVEVAEVAQNIPVSITAIFTNLSVGEHTASMWVRGVLNGGWNAYVNQAGWDSNHLVIKEYTPFGISFLPVVHK